MVLGRYVRLPSETVKLWEKRKLRRARNEERRNFALDMLRDRKPLEEIVKYSKLSLEQVTKLGQLHSLL